MPTSSKSKRLSDAYRFPGFRPLATLRGVFGDRKARVKDLEKQYMRAQLARAGTPGPKVIGIDEISIRKGHTYRIVVSDLIRRRPIWFGGFHLAVRVSAKRGQAPWHSAEHAARASIQSVAAALTGPWSPTGS